MLRRLYDWIIRLAGSRYAIPAMGVVSFAGTAAATHDHGHDHPARVPVPAVSGPITGGITGHPANAMPPRFSTVDQLRGLLAVPRGADAAAHERSEYVDTMGRANLGSRAQRYSAASGKNIAPEAIRKRSEYPI